tara:strand:+ start:59 stop:949 length:891 start_codon:yes stop_codon:yes gene_type:complete
MKILYIGVHSHENWGAEYWLTQAFSDLQIDVETIDYRVERKLKTDSELKEVIHQKSDGCDLVFLQRGDKLSPDIFYNITIPIIFWSTEPLKLKTDVDRLLQADIFSWVYVHSYSCIERIHNDFKHLVKQTSVMHNAAPKNKISFNNEKNTFAIFNRSLSWRRRWWLWPSRKMITRMSGKYGEEYFNDLKKTYIAVNIHYSINNLDDFESGIFEAMASGCVVISERLYEQTLKDLEMTDAIIQVDSPKEMKERLKLLKSNPEVINNYLEKSKLAIQQNTWNNRAEEMFNKFHEVHNE